MGRHVTMTKGFRGMAKTIMSKFTSLIEQLGEARQERASLAERHLALRTERASVLSRPKPINEVRDDIASHLATARAQVAEQLREGMLQFGRDADVDVNRVLFTVLRDVGVDLRKPILAAAVFAVIDDVLDDVTGSLAADWPNALDSETRAKQVDELDQQIADIEAKLSSMDAAAREAGLPL